VLPQPLDSAHPPSNMAFGPAVRHRASPEPMLSPEMLLRNDLVLVMDALQEHRLAAPAPYARARIHRLGGYGGFDVPDPYGEPRRAYERALALIERGIADYEREFWAGG
jgi:protein-tyrosine-phosphatase